MLGTIKCSDGFFVTMKFREKKSHDYIFKVFLYSSFAFSVTGKKLHLLKHPYTTPTKI